MPAKKLKKAHDLLVTGAVLTKSADLLKHAKQPTALAGDIQGLTGVGVAGATSSFVMEMALRGFKKRKRKR